MSSRLGEAVSAALESPYGRIESSWSTGATGTTFTVVEIERSVEGGTA
jgi:hypothetical protein